MPADDPSNLGDASVPTPGTSQPSGRSTPVQRRRALRPAMADMRGMDEGMRVLSYLISGVLLWGGLGWLGDYLLQTNFLLPIGIVLGAGLGVYVIIRRFGRIDPPSQSSGESSPDRPGSAN